jgi:hypothetical protein
MPIVLLLLLLVSGFLFSLIAPSLTKRLSQLESQSEFLIQIESEKGEKPVSLWIILPQRISVVLS